MRALPMKINSTRSSHTRTHTTLTLHIRRAMHAPFVVTGDTHALWFIGSGIRPCGHSGTPPSMQMDLHRMLALGTEERRRATVNSAEKGLWAVQFEGQENGTDTRRCYIPSVCPIDGVEDGRPLVLLMEPTRQPPIAYHNQGRTALSWLRLVQFPEEPLLGPFAVSDLRELLAWLRVSTWITLEGASRQTYTSVGSFLTPGSEPLLALPPPVVLLEPAQTEGIALQTDVYIRTCAGGFRAKAWMRASDLGRWKKWLAQGTDNHWIGANFFAHARPGWRSTAVNPHPHWALLDLYALVFGLEATATQGAARASAWCVAQTLKFVIPLEANPLLHTIRKALWHRYLRILALLGVEDCPEGFLAKVPYALRAGDEPPASSLLSFPHHGLLGEDRWILVPALLAQRTEVSEWMIARLGLPPRMRLGSTTFLLRKGVPVMPREYTAAGENPIYEDSESSDSGTHHIDASGTRTRKRRRGDRSTPEPGAQPSAAIDDSQPFEVISVDSRNYQGREDLPKDAHEDGGGGRCGPESRE